jgi:hypothetical protein
MTRHRGAPIANNQRALLEFIAGHNGLADRLMADHTDNGDGWCAACAERLGHRRWPCPVYNFAQHATETAR